MTIMYEDAGIAGKIEKLFKKKKNENFRTDKQHYNWRTKISEIKKNYITENMVGETNIGLEKAEEKIGTFEK